MALVVKIPCQVHANRPTDGSGFDDFPNLRAPRDVAAVERHEDLFAAAPLGRDNGIRILDCGAKGLLRGDMAAGFQGLHDMLAVTTFGRDDNDQIELHFGQHAVVVVIDGGRGAVGGIDIATPIEIQVAQANKLRAFRMLLDNAG